MCIFKLTDMRKLLAINTFLAVMLVFPMMLDAQNTIKVRLSGNWARFMSEPQGDEVIYPLIENLLLNEVEYSEFSHQGSLGLDAEVMLSLSDKAWFGLELSNTNFRGVNEYPPLYNFLFTSLNQLKVDILDIGTSLPINEEVMGYPLSYNTSLINILANFRLYFSSEGLIRPFIKVHSGVSLIGTEMAFKNNSDWPLPGLVIFVDGVPQATENLNFGAPILFARGTSNSVEGRVPALNFGGGIGCEFQINDKFSVYADYTFSMINSDILDGRPNFDYNDVTSRLERFNTFSNLSKISFGVCYTLGENFNIIGGKGGGSKGSAKTGRQHPYLPFYELKRTR